MDVAGIQGSDEEYKAPRVTNVLDSLDIGLTNLIGSIQHIAHFYTEQIFVPGYATYDKPPSTPTFSRVKFCTPESLEKS